MMYGHAESLHCTLETDVVCELECIIFLTNWKLKTLKKAKGEKIASLGLK